MVEYETDKLITISIGGRYFRYLSSYVIGLIDLCKSIPKSENMEMVEVGCFSGESSEIFAQFFKKVTCVEIWSKDFFSEDDANAEDVFDKRMARFDNVSKIKGTSIDGAKEFADGSLDFVYIDAMHDFDNVSNDIHAWIPKIKKDGYIGGHDYKHDTLDVIKAVNLLLGVPNKLFMDSSWLIDLDRERGLVTGIASVNDAEHYDTIDGFIDRMKKIKPDKSKDAVARLLEEAGKKYGRH